VGDVEVARHPDRPMTVDYIDLFVRRICQLARRQIVRRRRAWRTGFAKLISSKVMIVGHQKGARSRKRSICHFGCRPSGGLSKGDE